MYLQDVPGIRMTYPANVPADRQFALGHPFFGLMPGLFLYQTIWMREHNRVCDVLKLEHPDWDDERLFQTSKLVILGMFISHLKQQTSYSPPDRLYLVVKEIGLNICWSTLTLMRRCFKHPNWL